jgi:hypothetical protein
VPPWPPCASASSAPPGSPPPPSSSPAPRVEGVEVVGHRRPRPARARPSPTSTRSPVWSTPTSSWWPTPRSTPSTTRCPTVSTGAGRWPPWPPASTCCARSPSRPTPTKPDRWPPPMPVPALVLMEAFHYRYHPLFARVRELISLRRRRDRASRRGVPCASRVLGQGHPLEPGPGRRSHHGCRVLPDPHGPAPGRRRARGHRGRARLRSPGIDRYMEADSVSPTG